MPILGADMTAGTLVAWRRQPGDPVARGDIIAEVETEKGLIDVEVFVSGVLERILVGPGATVTTGTALPPIREYAPAAAPIPAEAPAAAAPAMRAVPVTSTPTRGARVRLATCGPRCCARSGTSRSERI